MSDRTHRAVTTHEDPGAGVPLVAGPGIHPTSQSHVPAGGAHTPPGLERASVAEMVGHEGTSQASTVHLTPASDPSLPPHITAPGETYHEATGGGVGQKVKHAVKEAWHGVKEITPGTAEHRQEFGTNVTMGGYRSQS